ncbi:hypothetical protein LWI29_027807 [Acer saccharum]|uniref:Uncharacterized protein n=1 Tax=Acer saccharum TaxID=4024 RepID=A0AA39T6S9_ACESA|nr:hypothetical protein LWI29_027807 [Acer saccharum]
MVLSGQFCRCILLRECHVKNANDNASSLWYHIGNGLIQFSPVEFCLVSGLAFVEYSESTSKLFKRKNSRLRRIYFQASKVKVCAIEAIPKWVTLDYAARVNNVTPKILNWQCTGTYAYADIQKTIFKFKNITIYRTLGPIDEETRIPYWTGMDKLKYVSPDVDGCVGEDDAQDDVQDDVDDAIHDDIDGDHPTKTF